MKKRICSLAMAAAMIPGMMTISAGAAPVTATPNTASVAVDGAPIGIGAYTIGGYNYFKLRDVAAALNGTGSSFEVGYDAAARSIVLTTGTAYTPAGGELRDTVLTAAKNAALSDQKILIDGIQVSMQAYQIDGYNYFQLRELGEQLGFGVEWDGAAKAIDLISAARENAEHDADAYMQRIARTADGIPWLNGHTLIDEDNVLWKLPHREGDRAEKLREDAARYLDGAILTTEGFFYDKNGNLMIDIPVRDAATYNKGFVIIDENGDLWTWGENHDAQLGYIGGEKIVEWESIGSVSSGYDYWISFTPRKIMTDVERVWLYNGGGCALKADRSLWAWGARGPLLKDSDKDTLLGYGGTFNSPLYAPSQPVKVADWVYSYDIESNALIRMGGSLHIDGEEIADGVTDVYADDTMYYTDERSVPIRIWLKSDGTLWGTGPAKYLGLAQGNTTLQVHGASFREYEALPYQSVPVKLMDGISCILGGAGYDYCFYVLTDDEEVIRIGRQTDGSFGQGSFEIDPAITFYNKLW